jgi:hypothetical protein
VTFSRVRWPSGINSSVVMLVCLDRGSSQSTRHAAEPRCRYSEPQLDTGGRPSRRIESDPYSRPRVIQTKLAVNPPGDAFEQEADRISQSVMRMPEPRVSRACACGGSCPACRSQGNKNERLQAKQISGSDTGRAEAPPSVHETLRSAGRPLDGATRSFMEPRFGHDFSRVRVHSGSTAERSARVRQGIPISNGRHARVSQKGAAVACGWIKSNSRLRRLTPSHGESAQTAISRERAPVDPMTVA